MNNVLLGAALLAAGTVPSFSQGTQKTGSDTIKVRTTPSVTVTSTRAEDRKSPVPFSEISRTEIEQRYTVQDFPALLSDLPSITFYSESGNSIGYNKMTMRGFDQRRIAVMINGVPQNDPEDHNVYWVDFPDLAASVGSIQVQRGAGLSNYGPAAIGGSVNLSTANFANDRSIRFMTGTGVQQYGSSLQSNVAKYSLELSSGLTAEKYAFYGRLSRINSEGYRDHSWTRLNSYFLSAVRYDENLTTQINVFGGPLADALTYVGVPKSHVQDPELRRRNYSDWAYDSTGGTPSYLVPRREQEIENFSQPHYELLNDWFISPGLTLKSTLFYYTGDGFFDYDASWADTTTLRLTQQYGFAPRSEPGNAIIRGFVGNRHGGWLPRITWSHEGGELTAGAEIRLHRSEHWGKVRYAENLPAGFDPDYQIYFYNGERDIMSVFAREQFKLGESLLLNAEGQLVRHSFRIRNERAGNLPVSYQNSAGQTVGGNGELFDVNFVFFNPRLGLNWNATENMSVYTSLAYTSREPRLANLYNADESIYGAQPLFSGREVNGAVQYDFGSPLVKPERLLDFELGSRYRDEHISLAANVYWMEFFDELVKLGRLDVFGNPVDGNAPRTRHIGAELEGAVFLIKGSYGALQLAANATFSRNFIVEYALPLSGTEVVSLADNPISGFPDFLANLALSYDNGPFSGRIVGKYVGGFYTDLYGDRIGEFFRRQLVAYTDNRVDPYFVANVNLSWNFREILSLQNLRLIAQVNNLFNRLYAAGGEGRQFFPAAERNFFVGMELGL